MKKSLLIAFILVQVLISGCEDQSEYVPDIQGMLHENGRLANWKAQSKLLDKTGYNASIGYCYYEDENDSIPDYYSIEISKSQKNKWLVYFSRDYAIKDLPSDFLNKKIDEIVKYDTESQIVTFIIGDKKVQYKLPVGASIRSYISTLPTPPPDIQKYDGDVIPDIGKQLQEEGRPCEWKSKCVYLDKTGFNASAGPVIYKNKFNSNPDFYSIGIEKAVKDGFLVYFRRDYAIKDLPDDFLEKPIDEIVKYDSENRTVTFILGDKKVQYKLPVGEHRLPNE